MSNDKTGRMIRFLVIILSVWAGLIINWPGPVQAGSELPPRDTPAPSQPGDDDRRGDNDKPVGAFIELHPQTASTDLWAVVQWQDSTGTWHEVEGWRGALTADGYQQWWVAAKDFGAGPFRWVITPDSNGSPLAISLPFKLPIQANQILQIEATIK